MNEKEIEKIFRKHFKHIRAKNDCKLETLARALNISPSYISQWENNKRDLSDDLVTAMFSYFNYDDGNIRKNFIEHLKCFHLCYLDIVYLKGYDRFKCFESNLPNNFSESMEYPYYLVTYYLYNCTKPNLELQSKIEMLLPFLSDEFVGIYYLAAGCACNNIKDFNSAITYFKQGFKATTSASITSMLHFNCGNAYISCFTLSEALIEITIAKTQFDECLAVKRSIASMNSIGIISLSNFKYEKTIDILTKTIELCEYLEINVMDEILVNNLAFAYLLNEEYNQSLKYSKKLLYEHKRVKPCTYFYILYDLLLLHKREEYFTYISEYRNLVDSKKIIPDYHHGLIELLEFFWIEKKTKLEINTKVKNVYDSIKKEGTVELNLFVLDFIIKYYMEHKNYKKTNEFLIYKNKLISFTR